MSYDPPHCQGHSKRLGVVNATWRLAIANFPRGRDTTYLYWLCDACVDEAIRKWQEKGYRPVKTAL